LLIDSHCHLADPAFDADREAALARAREAGVTGVVVVGDTVASSERGIALCESHQGLAATAGIHPHHASQFDDGAARRLEDLVARPEVCAVGETGLDYHYDHSPRDRQRESFRWHLETAARTRKPAVIHCREADDDTARLISEAPAGLTAVLHCFSGGRDLLDAALERGLFVSFSGMITFRKWDQFWAVSAVPDGRLLIETDAPFLAPVPNRGRRNEPAFLTATAQRLAALRGLATEHLAALTTANALNLFPGLPASAVNQPRPSP
jgi:TatD DNase family protein